jgi:hypothetical protein
LQLFDYWRQICRLGVSSRSQGFYGHRAHLLARHLATIAAQLRAAPLL